MDTEKVKEEIGTNVYHITAESNVPLHKHNRKDEVFYCIKGSGYGVREKGEEKLSVGQSFIARAGTRHSLRTDGDLYVASFVIPVVEEAHD